MRVAIFTAIFGSYDDLKRPVQQLGANTDFYCFSDEVRAQSIVQGWQYIHVPADPAQHPRMQAKRFKVLSHKVFPRGKLAFRFSRSLFRRRYDAIVWVDASLHIKGSTFARDIGNLCKEDALLVYNHPDRDCVLEEVQASLPMEKYKDLPLQEQVAHYVSDGLVAHSGLFACGVIGRSCPASSKVKKFDEAWWAENKKWTYQDQLSFAYLARKRNMNIETIPGSLWDNQYFDFMPHRSNI